MTRTAFHRQCLAAALAVLAVLPAAAGAGLLDGLIGGEPEILPVEQAFAFHAARVAPDRVALTWEVREGYYLYRDQIDVALAPGADNALARIELPRGKQKDDPYFGRLAVYAEPITVLVALTRPAEDGLTLIVRYRGCAEAGLCYPPQRIEYRLGQGIVASGVGDEPIAPPGAG